MAIHTLLFALLLNASSAPAGDPPRLTVAVAPAALGAGIGDAWLGDALAHALAGRLWHADSINALSARQLKAAMRSANVAPAALTDAKVAGQLARELGADLIVASKLDAPKTGALQLALTVFTREGRVDKRATVFGKPTALLALEQDAADVLASVLPKPAAKNVRAAAPATTEAGFRAAYEGLVLTDGQSLGPRAADANVPSALTPEVLARAKTLLNKAIAAEPKLTVAYAGAAVVAMLENDPGLTAAKLAAVADDPYGALAASFVYMRRGNFEQAIRTLQAAIRAHPGFLHARGTLGQLYNHFGRFREARATFEAYAKVAPHQPWVLAQVGYTLAKQKKLKEAVAITQRALALAPDSPALLTELASRHIDAGELDKAATALERVLAKDPNNARAQVRLGYVHLQNNADRKAVSITEEALPHLDSTRQRRELAYAHLNLARAWGRLGQYDVALEQLAAAKAAGLRDCGEIEGDPRLARFRADPRYQKAKF